MMPNRAARVPQQHYTSTPFLQERRAGMERGRGEELVMDVGKAEAAEALVAEKKLEQEALKIRNDQEWHFFDTARINVKAGTGGNG